MRADREIPKNLARTRPTTGSALSERKLSCPVPRRAPSSDRRFRLTCVVGAADHGWRNGLRPRHRAPVRRVRVVSAGTSTMTADPGRHVTATTGARAWRCLDLRRTASLSTKQQVVQATRHLATSNRQNDDVASPTRLPDVAIVTTALWRGSPPCQAVTKRADRHRRSPLRRRRSSS